MIVDIKKISDNVAAFYLSLTMSSGGESGQTQALVESLPVNLQVGQRAKRGLWE